MVFHFQVHDPFYYSRRTQYTNEKMKAARMIDKFFSACYDNAA